MNVQDKCIVITGGSGGLGSEMAKLLACNGATVIILDLDEEKGNALVKEIQRDGYKAEFYPMDLTSEEDWKSVVAAIVKSTGKIDVLVNNAGINIRKSIEEMELSEWNTMMLVNVGSVFLGAKYVIPVMRRQGGGAIINTSSVCGLLAVTTKTSWWLSFFIALCEPWIIGTCITYSGSESNLDISSQTSLPSKVQCARSTSLLEYTRPYSLSISLRTAAT